MLTFRFTGVNGEMIEEEMLAAGMVGKQVRFEFSEEWDGLRKVAVYKAGDTCCTTVDVGQEDAIPAEVLSHSLQRLQVGIYGISEDGTVVTPTIYAAGPFIHISAVIGDDPCFAPENTFWIKLEEAMGDVLELTTKDRTCLVWAINEIVTRINTLTEETVHVTTQDLTKAQQRQARKNIGAVSVDDIPASGLDETSANLLLNVLQNGVYTTDQYENMLYLREALCGTILCNMAIILDNVTADNPRTLVAENDSYTTKLTAADGYELDTVTVTMGDVDVTAQVYAGGVVSIPVVTGNIMIMATAKEVEPVEVQDVVRGATAFVDGYGLQINGQSSFNAIILPVGQYLKQGATYQFSLGSAASDYMYSVQVLTANAAGLSFDYVKNSTVNYNTVTGQVVDSGWMTADYSYVPTGGNQILLVNFKRADNGVMIAGDYSALEAGFTVQEMQS